MPQIFPHKIRLDNFGRPIVPLKSPDNFSHLIGLNINDVILFQDGSDELLQSGATILPRHFFLFVGNKNGEIQFKPYEYNEHRIVVTTYNNIITGIDSIG